MLYSTVQHRWTRIILAVAGSFIYSVGISYFVTPAGLYTGGFLGVGQIIRTLLVQNCGMDFGQFDVAGLFRLECSGLFVGVPLHIRTFRSQVAAVYRMQHDFPQYIDAAGGADPV